MKNTLTYRSLVAYIISVVPEIMELKMGCHVKDFRGDCVLREKYKHTHEDLFETLDGRSVVQIREIIGRPITLADVLLAVDKAIYDMGQAISFSVNETGRMSFGAYQSATWKLGKPLSGQDEDMINWLVSLFPISK